MAARDIIIKPLLSEKSYAGIKDKKYSFVVAKNANKTEIKIAFESIFNVKVVDVNIINVLPRAKRVGRYEGKVSGYKKAIVTLSADENLNVLAENAAQ